MKKISIYTLKAFRRLYAKVLSVSTLEKPLCEQDPDKVSEIIYAKLIDNKPCMIARFGSTELTTVVNYLGVTQGKRSIFKYIKGETLPWWWNENIKLQMQQWSGFFPPTQQKIEQFCELMLEDIKEVDVLGSWLVDERYFLPLMNAPQLIARGKFDPFWVDFPWTKALAGKKVLVIHPFASTIHSQYLRRTQLFRDPDFLPEFELVALPAVQSLGGNTQFKDWFEALESMKTQMSVIDFDIALIGAGAYGFPLAAYAKRIGKKAVHVGGSLQLFFGIIGKRWENEPKVHGTDYPGLINEYWVRPDDSYKPKNFNAVEDGCYW